MQIKILTLSFNPLTGLFDDSELQNFMAMHNVASVRDYFFIKNDQPILTLVITYNPLDEDAVKSSSTRTKADDSWKKMLTEADMGLFTLLREWRGKKAKKEGLPPYILATNKQLATIVKVKPQSITELLKIEGVGEGKAKKYGEEILSLTKIDTMPTNEIKPE